MAGSFNGNRIDIASWVNYSPVSISFWFNITTLKTQNRLVGSDDEWEIRVTQDWSAGSYRLANELWGSGTGTPPISTTVIAAATWYHAVGMGTSGGTAILYLNGVNEASGSCVDTPTNLTLSIGGRNTASVADGLIGFIDDVRVYNRILTEAEILTIYACRGCDNINNGLQGRWLMDEGAEGAACGTIVDYTGNRNGTPNGTPTYAASWLKTSVHRVH
jgi:hypothetical protein